MNLDFCLYAVPLTDLSLELSEIYVIFGSNYLPEVTYREFIPYQGHLAGDIWIIATQGFIIPSNFEF